MVNSLGQFLSWNYFMIQLFLTPFFYHYKKLSFLSFHHRHMQPQLKQFFRLAVWFWWKDGTFITQDFKVLCSILNRDRSFCKWHICNVLQWLGIAYSRHTGHNAFKVLMEVATLYFGHDFPYLTHPKVV